MHSVMAIHVAEEARHISFAHKYLRHRVPKMSRVGRFGLSLAFPVTMRVLCDVIVIPPASFWSEHDIPKSVKKDLFWGTPESRQVLSDYFADVRMLADEIGLMNPASRAALEAAQDRREAVALPQRAQPGPAPRPLLSRQRINADALCRNAVLLQRCVLRVRVPGELHPPDAGRAGLPDRRDAAHRPGRLRRLRRVRLGLPGRRDRAALEADRSAAAVPEHQCRVLQAPRDRPAARAGLAGPSVRQDRDPLRVAIVGSGPAAMYAADELLTQPGVQVNVFDRLPTPYGLVRAGVAPDHQQTKQVTALFDTIADQRRLRVLPQRRGRQARHA